MVKGTHRGREFDTANEPKYLKADKQVRTYFDLKDPKSKKDWHRDSIDRELAEEEKKKLEKKRAGASLVAQSPAGRRLQASAIKAAMLLKTHKKFDRKQDESIRCQREREVGIVEGLDDEQAM